MYTVPSENSACPPQVVTTTYTTLYDIGDLLYIANQAWHGQAQRICVKDIVLNHFDGLVPIFLYRDTTNRKWFEYELVPLTTAQVYIDNYNAWLADQQSQWEQAITNCPSIIVVPPVIKYNWPHSNRPAAPNEP